MKEGSSFYRSIIYQIINHHLELVSAVTLVIIHKYAFKNEPSLLETIGHHLRRLRTKSKYKRFLRRYMKHTIQYPDIGTASICPS